MKLILNKKPKGVTIVEGFPGFGLIGTIATEFLVEHLDTEQIGSIQVTDVPAMIAIHQNKVVEPVSLHYNKKYNIVIVHALNMGSGVGWDMAGVISDLANQLQAKEIVSLEGVGSMKQSTSNNIFYYTTEDGKKKQKLDTFSKPLVEGIVVGVTGALLATEKNVPVTSLFAEVHSQLPDSKAAAAIIKGLDQYLGLEVDPQPLVKQAQDFEKKLKSLMAQAQSTGKLQQKKSKGVSYIG